MIELTEATLATAEKLGLQMRFKKTEILPIQYQSSKTTPAVPLGNEGIIKVVDHLNTRVLIAAQMASMLKKPTTG